MGLEPAWALPGKQEAGLDSFKNQRHHRVWLPPIYLTLSGLMESLLLLQSLVGLLQQGIKP